MVITSNRTREIHDAIKRRCYYHWVDYPDAARELEILRVRAPGTAEALSREVVAFVQGLREIDLFKAPGVAATINWAQALTQLTNITRQLRDRDVDAAVERASAEVADWDGGTRIGHCLDAFNREWSRRVCGQGAVVLFITDGLDRDVGHGLEPQVDRLRKSCRRLVWLNPLLRYEGFEPKAAGMRALLPHVDELCPVHNLDRRSHPPARVRSC